MKKLCSLLLSLLPIIAFSQNSILGTFPSIDGGFENQPSSGTASVGTTPFTSAKTTYTATDVNPTITFNSAGGRSGPKYVSVITNNSGQGFYTPTAALAQNTQYVVQYYFLYTGASLRSLLVSASPDGGTNFGATSTVNNVASISTWTKRTEVITSANNPSNTFGIIKFGASGGAISTAFNVDDIVVYAGAAADVTAPSVATSPVISNASLTSQNVSWTAPAAGVDGGGYMVVRYTSAPNVNDDPLQNGVYAVGNTISGTVTGTVVYIGTSTSFVSSSLTSGTAYYYKIYTVDKAFNYSSEIITNLTTSCPSATISYSGSPYCNPSGTASVTLTGTAGGTYSSTAGLTINSSTGDITLSSSTLGTYTVTYTVAAAGGCSAFSTTTSVSIFNITNNTLSYTNGLNGTLCNTAAEGGNATLTAPAGTVFINVGFASYGTPTGTCPSFVKGTCHATTSLSITESYVLGNNTASIPATNGVFGDPCVGTVKTLAVAATYTQPVCSGSSPGTITGTTPTGGNGTYTYLWEKSTTSSSAGFGAATGTTNARDYASPTLTQTTWYRRTVTSGGCSSTSVIQVTVIAAPSATISYAGTPYCSNAGTASVTFSGTTGGTYSSAAGLTINSATGDITLGTSTAGTYTVTYTMTNTGCTTTATASVTITALPVATFSYSGSPYCKNAANPSPTFNGGGAAGTFSSTAGLVFVSTSTGQINLASSTAGTYTVTNTIAATGGCPVVTATSSVTITTLPVATFSYAGSPYCKNAANPSPTFSGGGAAGTFSSTAGLVFVSTSTGQINLASSTAGTYTVTNTIAASGGCGVVTATSSVTITTLSVATFSYSGTPYCKNASNPSPTFSGGGVAGTFSSTAGLVFVSTSTGQIDLAASTAGTYTVTNTIAASAGCPIVTATSSVTISALPVATFSYSGTPYCKNASNPSPTFSGGGVAGTFSSTAGLVFVSTSTGQIDLAASTAGIYTVTNTIAASGGCGVVTATSSVTITALPVATFSYSGSPYCKNAANPSPTFSGGGVAGTFSSTAGLVFISTATGQINLASSTAGTYTVTNTIAAAGGCPVVTATSSVTITTLPVATFSYAGSPYCKTAANPSPTFSGGGVAGTFSSTAGLVFVSTSTGQVDLAASTVGTYTVTNTIVASAGCPIVTATASVTISAPSSATISYSGSPYCSSAGTASVTFSGTAGGTYSSAAGLSINSSTGDITLGTSTAGTYTVTYTMVNGGCTNTATTSVTITAAPSATINYTSSPYCSSAGTATVTRIGTAGGGYSSTPGLTIDATTGAITLASSTAGTYTVTYTVAAAGGCAAFTTTASITITAAPSATISYAGSPYCSTTGTASVTRTGTPGGTYSSTTGLTINSSTGDITLGTSTAGTYTVTYTVAASAGCAAFTTTTGFSIGTTPTVSGTPTATCVGGSTGTITASASGGSSPYTYSLNAGAYQASATFSGLAAGTYTVNAKGSEGCIGSTSVTVSPYANSTDDQTAAGTNTWIGHTYDGISFTSYIGQFTEAETFNESFGGSTVCFNVVSSSVTRSIYTETFSVRFRMNSTKKGLYVVDLGSDDGSRLRVDGTLVYNNWSDQAFSSKPSILINLKGTSSLVYEFYENGGGNQVVFQNLTLILANTLSANTTQSICTGNTGADISGDTYGALPSGLTLSGTGYQWSYSTTPGGARTNISGATGATFTPDGTVAPFNTAGTYYVYRNAIVSSANNVSPNPYVAINESNAAIITVTAVASATINYPANPYCSTAGTATVTRTGTAGGTYSSTAGLTLNSATGAITLGTSTAGTYTVTYSVAATGGCAAFSTTTSVTVSDPSSATISYAGSPYCSSAGTASVTMSGTTGGTYSSTAGLTINSATGDITLGTSTVGTYTVTYTMINGGCTNTATTSVTITAAPLATISYAGSPYCSSAGTATVTRTGTAGGTYSSTTGLVLNTSTGAVTLGTSTAGTYTVTYTVAASGGCAAYTTTATITITTQPNATFAYAGPYCSTAGTVTPSGTSSGATGTFASTAGLSINSSTGVVTLGTSTPGSYTVTYTVPASGGCAVYTRNSSITITAAPSATISYAGSPYCSNSGTATVTQTGTSGGTYSSTAGLTINSSTGDITLGTSTAGTYIVTYAIAASGGCAAFSTTTSVTINTAPIATINYSGSPYCTTGGTVTGTRTGRAGGTYSSTAGLIINSTTGAINLGTSTAGTYTVTYTIAASGGCAVFSTTASVTVSAPSSATISYGGSPYCSGAATSTVTRTGTAGGTYSSTSGLTIDGATGDINLGTSTPGTYTVTYTMVNGGCTTTATTLVTITPTPSATINYTGSPYCTNAGTASVTRTGTAGGTYSSTSGLSINSGTGDITLASSTAGTYTVTYTVAASGGCVSYTTTTSVTITAAPSATINYAGTPYCSTAGTATVTRTGTSGGTYSSTTGLTINSGTGNITLASSTAGTYTVTYTVAASGGCAAYTTATSVTISDPASATISYGGTPYCSNGGTATVTRTGTAGGTYSSTSGLTINSATGDITLGTSTPGSYTVTYTMVNGGCTTTATVTLTAPPSAAISYPNSPYCINCGTAAVTQTGTTGGTYSSTAGLSINATTGTITLASSTAGTYTVTYTVPASGGCASYSTTTSVTINAATNVYYVNDNSNTGSVYTTAVGNNANPGTQSSPFLTINRAIAVANAGDTIYVDAGSYGEEVNPDKEIFLFGANAAISPNTGTRNAESILNNSTGSAVNVSTVSRVVIKGFKITGNSNYSVLSNTTGHRIKLEKNLFDATRGLNFINPDTLLVIDNKFTNLTAGEDGFYVAGNYNGTTGSYVQANNNTWINGQMSGMNISGTQGDIYNNTFSNVTYYGILVANYSSLNITRNVFSGIINPDVSVNTWGSGIRIYTPTAGMVTTITNNYFNNNFVGVGVRGPGNLAGTNITISNNSFSGNTDANINNAATGQLNAICNWFGANDAVQISSSIKGNVLYSTFLKSGTDSDVATPGFQPTGSCSGPSATISYAGSPHCTSSGTGSVLLTGTTGGTFSSTTGLTINSTTGDVTLGTSTPGTYTVTYTIPPAGGWSQFTTTANITVSAPASATISYPGSPYCTSAGSAPVTFSGTTGGTYTSTAGLVINSTTGEVNLYASSPGTYTVTYTVAASGGCAAYSTTANITINASPAISQLSATNLIANYKFEGNANDATGNDNGTLQNSPVQTTDRFGIANRAFTFNGASQYVSTANAYNNPLNFTISIWFKTTTTTGGKLMGFGKSQTGLSAQYDRHLYMNNAGKIYFGIYSGTVNTVNSSLSYNDGNWHLATATLSSTSGMALYMDGALVGTNAATQPENYTGYWRIGYDNVNGWTSQPSSFYFNGTLDDALIYDRAISASEAATLYTSPDGGANSSPVCSGSALNLTATTVPGATYAWTGPNGFTSSLQNPSLTYSITNAGTYSVQVTAAGCTSTAYTNVTSTAVAGQWTGNISTDWSDAANWCNGVLPTSTTNVVITASATRMPVIVSTVLSNNLTINSGASVTISSGGNLKVAGNLVNSGTYTDNGTTTFNGPPGAQVFSGVTVFNNLVINNSDGVILPASITVKNNLTLTTGLLNANNFTITVAGNWINNTSPSAFAPGTGTVTFNGTAAQTIDGSSSTTFNNLAISNSGNTVSLLSNINVGDDLSVTAGTLDLGAFTANRVTPGGTLLVANNATLKIGGTNTFPSNFTVVNLVVASTVEYSGTNQAVSNKAYGNLKLTSSGGAATKTLPAAPLVVAGNLTSAVGAGTSVSFTAGAPVTVNGNVNIGASTTFDGSSYNHSIGGNWVNNGTFTGAASTVTFTGANTTVSGAGAQNFNNLTVAASGVTFSANTIQLSGNLATTGSGSFSQASNGTLIMSGTGKTISGTGVSLNNLTVNGSLTTAVSLPVTGNLLVNGSFNATVGTIAMPGSSKTISGAGTIGFSTLDAGGSITANTDFSIASGLIVNGSLSATAGTATFTGTSFLSGTANLYNATIDGTKLQLSSGAVLGIANALTITSGILDATTSGPNTVNFNGTGAQNINAITYGNLVLSNGNTKTATGNITTANDITIATGTTFDPSSYTHSIYGNWINNGTFIPATSTVQFVGSATAYIRGVTTFNILTSNATNSTTELLLQSHVSAAIVNMINGIISTGSDTLTITNTRTGNGYIFGNIQRTHAFTTGVAYAFEGPDNTITFSSVSGVNSITVSVSEGSISDFPFGGSISRVYNINIPSGTYTDELRLHYEDDELNGNNESSMALWHYNGTSWVSMGKSGNSTTANYVEQNNLTNLNNRWTLSDNSNLVQWNGSVSSDWNTAANWTVLQGSGSRPPIATDIVDLGSATFNNQPTISNNVTVKSIVFGSAKAVTLTLASGGSLTTLGDINGNWTSNATHTINANDQSLTVNGNLDLSDGTNGHAINLNIGTGTVTVMGSIEERGGANVTFSGAGALNVAQNFNYTSGTFTAGSGTVTYNGTENQDVANINYNNLTINKTGGLAAINNPVNVAGNLLISSGQLDNHSTTAVAGNVTISAGATVNNYQALHVGGNWNNNGNYTGTGSSITFNGTGSQTISASTFNNFIIDKPSGTATLTGNVLLTGDLTINSGTFDIQAFSFDRNLPGGTATTANGATFMIGANNPPRNFTNVIISPTSNTIFYGSTPLFIGLPGITFGNVIFRGTGVKTALAAMTVKGDLTIENSSTFNATSAPITLEGNWTNNGTFIPGTSTVLLNGISKTVSGVTTFNKVTVSGTYDLLNNITFNNLLHVTSTGIFRAGASILTTLNGDFTNNGVLYNLGTTTFTGNVLQTLSLVNAVQTVAITVNFNGTVSPILNSTSVPQYGFLNINNTGGINPSIGWEILYALNVSSGASFNGGPSTHNLYGSLTNNGTITSSGTLNFLPATAKILNLGNNFSSTGLVDFGGAGAITIAGNPTAFNDVLINNTNPAGVTPSSNWNIGNDLTIAPGSLFKAVAYSYLVGGDIINKGTLNAGTSSFTLNGTGVQDIFSASAFNNLIVNKSSGLVTESIDIAINGNLNFISGNIETGNNSVNLSSSATLTGAAQNTGWVNGNLQKNIGIGATTKTFEVGDDVDYAPATLAFSNVTSAGDLTVSTTETEHPDITNSVINPDKSVNRYWTMTNNGIVFTDYNATFNFVSSDVDAGATTSAFKVGLFNGSSWSLPGTASPNPTNIQATGVTSFGDFAIGEVCNGGTAISYAATPYCSNAGTIQVALTGTTGGTFTSSAGLSINAATGDIDPATSVAGTYSVTYTIDASGSCPVYITTANITITTPPSATIAYPASPYCSNAGTASITLTGMAGGTYSSTPGLSINPTTGEITLGTSTAGTYTVTYTVAAFGGCAAYTTTTSVTITAAPSATISFAGSPYCSNGGTASVTFSGTAGGTYSSTTGLSINSSTGAVTLGTSTAGTYTVTYSIAAAGGCAAYSTTADITITPSPAATISYAGSPHCAGAGTSTVAFSGTPGGTYSSTTGLTIDATTGAVDIGTSTAGTYTVTYTVAASGGCAAYTTTANITITPTVSTPVFQAGATSSRCQQAGNITYAATANNSTGITYTLDAASISAGNTIDATTAVVTYAAGWSGTSVITATATGCNGPATATHTVTINAIPSVSGTSTITCVGGSAGTITASGSGATAPYTYSLDAVVYQSSPIFTGLAAGTYTLNIQSSNGCYGSTSVVVNTYPTSTDDETETATDSWVGHVYDGINFNNYIGHYTEAEEFNQNFGGTTCFNVTSNGATSSIYTNTYSVKYRMTSTKRGLYVVDLGSDDGSRLTVDGTLVYNNWSNQSFVVKPGVLMNLNGASSLVYEYYDNLFSNQVAFQNLTQILANTLTTNTSQSICMGNIGTVISGDDYGTLPAGITLSGTGYQWSYSTTPGGVRNNIPGATGSTYTPSTSGAPFNTPGTFYIYRNAILSSSNNISPDPYVATNESDAAVVTVIAAPSATISYGGSPYCSDAGVASVTFAGTSGGTYSSTTGLSIDAVTGAVDLIASLSGTYTVTYTVAAAAPCGQYETTTTIVIKTAGVWIGAVNADWNNSGNWLCGAVPTASTNILIQASMPQYPVLSSGISAGNDLTIESGASLTINNNGTIQIGGNINNNGIFNVIDGTVEMNGTSPQSIPAGTFAGNKIKNLTISNDVTLVGEDSITGVLSFGNANNKTFSTGGYLTLKSSAAGTARVDDVTNGGVNFGNNVTGDVKVERYISARRAWRLLTAPVNTAGNKTIHDTWQEGVNNTSLDYAANQNPVPGYGTHITWGNNSALGFDVGVNNNPSILGYDNGSIAWEPVSSTNIDITSYPAYMIFVRGDRNINLSQRTYSPPTPTVLRTIGELRAGNQSFDVAPTGFTVIGNPYASAIDLNNIAKGNSTNVQDNFYLWDPKITGSSGVGGFVNLSWNGEFYDITPFTGDDIGQYIQSGSAFLVRSSDGTSSGTLVVKEADKTALGVNINRPLNIGGIKKITATLYSINTDGTTSIVDGSLNTFGEKYSNEIDQMDAVKLSNFAENLSTMRDGQKFTVERRQPVITKDTIYYRINQMKQKEYDFEIAADGFESGVISAWFEDTYLHTSKSINLDGTTNIRFRVTGEAGSYSTDRFRLVFRQLSALPVTINSIKAWQQSEGVQVEWKTGNETNINQYDVEKSTDGLSFTRSALVKVTGNGNGKYTWLDENAKEGNNYYRIKSIGVEGLIKYSTIAKVYISKGQWQIVLNTNIIRGGVIGFRLNKMPEGRYGVRMLNSVGQVIFTKQLSHTGGNGTGSINVNTHLAKGMYMVEFTKPDKKITKKVFVE